LIDVETIVTINIKRHAEYAGAHT